MPRSDQQASSRLLLELPRGERGKLTISRSSFRGHMHTKVTMWYPADDGLKPKSLSIRDHEVAAVAAVLDQVARRVAAADCDHETIGEWSDREDDPLPRGHCLQCGADWRRCTCRPEPAPGDDG